MYYREQHDYFYIQHYSVYRTAAVVLVSTADLSSAVVIHYIHLSDVALTPEVPTPSHRIPNFDGHMIFAQ